MLTPGAEGGTEDLTQPLHVNRNPHKVALSYGITTDFSLDLIPRIFIYTKY